MINGITIYKCISILIALRFGLEDAIKTPADDTLMLSNNNDESEFPLLSRTTPDLMRTL